MANGTPSTSKIPRLINPSSYLLQQVEKGVDTFSANRWKKHMTGMISGAVERFYGGDDSALQEVMQLTQETGQTQEFMPMIRDRLQEGIVERREQEGRERRGELAPGILDALSLPQGVSDTFAKQFVDMYSINPDRAMDFLGLASRQQISQATADAKNVFDIENDPDYQAVTAGDIKYGPMVQFREGLPVDEATGRVTGRSSYEIQPEDYRHDFRGMEQIPTSDLIFKDEYAQAIARGDDPTPWLQFEQDSPIDEKWILENVNQDAARKYLTQGTPDYHNPAVLIGQFNRALDNVDRIRLRSNAAISYGNEHGRLSASRVTTAWSMLGPGTRGAEELTALAEEMGIKSPSMIDWILNPSDITRWAQAPQQVLDLLKDYPDKEALEEKYSFALGQVNQIKQWGIEREDYIKTRLEEHDRLMGFSGSGGGDTTDIIDPASPGSQDDTVDTSPSGVEEEEEELPPGWLINNAPEYYKQNFTRETMAIQELEPVTASETEIRENGGRIPEGKISANEAREILDRLFPIR